MLLAHKITLDPTLSQERYFLKACGVARFSYNWALGRWKESFSNGKKVSETDLRKEFNAIKQHEYPWMSEVTKSAPQQAIKNLGMAFQRFFKKQSRYPRFKKKYGCHDSFRADNGPSSKGSDAVRTDGKQVLLPRIGWVRMREALRFEGQIKSAIVSKRSDKWFVSMAVEVETHPNASLKNHGEAVGVDLGIRNLAVVSDGTVVGSPSPHKRLLSRLGLLNRSLSRKQKGSRNRLKAKKALSRIHYRISNIRNDALHKLTTHLALNHDTIVIEDLNVSGMAKNRRLSRSIMDQGFHEFRRQLEYKAKLYGSHVIVADRFYPSTKTCSQCGVKHDMNLGQRIMSCRECGLVMDRDLNAAINLRNLAVSSTVTACGQEGSGIKDGFDTKPAWAKQEQILVGF
jgi:putative transposase